MSDWAFQGETQSWSGQPDDEWNLIISGDGDISSTGKWFWIQIRQAVFFRYGQDSKPGKRLRYPVSSRLNGRSQTDWAVWDQANHPYDQRVFMYVSVCQCETYISMYMHFACAHICMHMCMHSCLRAGERVCVHAIHYARMHAYILACVLVCACVYISTRIPINTYPMRYVGR